MLAAAKHTAPAAAPPEAEAEAPAHTDADGRVLAPHATVAETDLESVRAGQRKVNLIWEFTQATVTVLITVAAIYAALTGRESTTLNNGFFVVISTYLARTNHTKTGGVGPADVGR